MEVLHSKILGQGKPLLILHGFLGMSDNWKTLGNAFAEHFQVHLIDQRNHGRSFHSPDFSYELLAEDLKQYCSHYQLSTCYVLGHSMGGKTAMHFSLQNPNFVEKLVVADIAPKTYPAHHQYILKALQEVDFTEHTSRKSIENVLANYIEEKGVIQFLMKNIYRITKDQLGYRFNLATLYNKYDAVTQSNLPQKKYDKPTLFLKGSRSNYIDASDEMTIKSYFPLGTIQEISNSGHWLHAENPKEFYSSVMNFLIN